MPEPFIAKLRHGASLTQDDEAALRGGVEHVRVVEPGTDRVREGASPGSVRLVLDGIAFRYKTLPGGRRQVLAFLLSGDMCDLQVSILGAMDHSIRTLTRCRIATISQAVVDRWTERPHVIRALWWATLVDEAIMREWIVNLGARQAEERVAHLLVELLFRLRAVGLATDEGYTLPLSQEKLGQCTGLSTVHVNRVLTRLRRAGLVSFQRHRVDVEDLDALLAMAGFDPGYLHLKEQLVSPAVEKTR